MRAHTGAAAQASRHHCPVKPSAQRTRQSRPNTACGTTPVAGVSAYLKFWSQSGSGWICRQNSHSPVAGFVFICSPQRQCSARLAPRRIGARSSSAAAPEGTTHCRACPSRQNRSSSHSSHAPSTSCSPGAHETALHAASRSTAPAGAASAAHAAHTFANLLCAFPACHPSLGGAAPGAHVEQHRSSPQLLGRQRQADSAADASPTVVASGAGQRTHSVLFET